MISRLRKVYRNLNPEVKNYKSQALINLDRTESNRKIADAITANKAFMVARFGDAELNWYLAVKHARLSKPKRILAYIRNETPFWRQNTAPIDNMTFKPNKSWIMTKVFESEFDFAIPQVDLLGSWLKAEDSRYVPLKSNVDYTFLLDIEPFFIEKPWTKALKAKKVLVIHPMIKEIKKQYALREKLFVDPELLPEFELITIRAKYFDDPKFNTWEKIMDFYKTEIKTHDFDVALIGCGSWGMPVAAYVKEMGKTAIHLGGALQLVFGIWGRRWESEAYLGSNYPELLNDYWIRPDYKEKPNWAAKYEIGNPYW